MKRKPNKNFLILQLFLLLFFLSIIFYLAFMVYRPVDSAYTATQDDGTPVSPNTQMQEAAADDSAIENADNADYSDDADDSGKEENADVAEAAEHRNNSAAEHQETPETEEQEKSEEDAAMHPDRTYYCDGFFYEPLTPEIIDHIKDVSYHDNDRITYEDLYYLGVLYCDFDGQTQSGELICNRLIAQDLLEIFKALYDASYQIEKIRLIDEYQADDDASCADNNTSCFNYRVVAGSDTLSKHALGMAVDINPFYNPYITYPDGKERISPAGSEAYADRQSGLAHMILKDDLCYRLFIEHGFTWGGEWKSIKDYQHFQKSTN